MTKLPLSRFDKDCCDDYICNELRNLLRQQKRLSPEASIRIYKKIVAELQRPRRRRLSLWSYFF